MKRRPFKLFSNQMAITFARDYCFDFQSILAKVFRPKQTKTELANFNN